MIIDTECGDVKWILDIPTTQRKTKAKHGLDFLYIFNANHYHSQKMTLQKPLPQPLYNLPQVPSPVDSRVLFGARKELVIVHGGREYRLRMTQNGKLILTA